QALLLFPLQALLLALALLLGLRVGEDLEDDLALRRLDQHGRGGRGLLGRFGDGDRAARGGRLELADLCLEVGDLHGEGLQALLGRGRKARGGGRGPGRLDGRRGGRVRRGGEEGGAERAGG